MARAEIRPDDDRVPVVVIDRHDISRYGLRAIISGADGLSLVGDTADEAEGRALVEQIPGGTADETQAPRAVVVVDDALAASPDSLEALRDCARVSALVVAAAAPDTGMLLEALRHGVDGYVLKSSPRAEIIEIIRSAAAGRPAIDRELTASLIHDLAEQKGSPAPEPLTPRELDVLDGLAEGRTNKEIAGRLAVSMGTVKIHVEHILAKLGAAGRTEAAVRAVEMGMLPQRAAASSESPNPVRPGSIGALEATPAAHEP